MELILERSDLDPVSVDIPCSATKFRHFKPEVQKVIAAVGKARFIVNGGTNYNVIHPPAPLSEEAKADIVKRLRKIFRDQLNVPDRFLHREALLVDDLGVDSLDSVELILGIEECFQRELAKKEIPHEVSLNAKTFGDVLDYLFERAAERIGP